MTQFIVSDGLGDLGKFSLKKLVKRLPGKSNTLPIPTPPVPKFVPQALVPKIPGVTVAIPTSLKEAKAIHKADVKEAREAWVQGPMKWTAMIDPVARKHYEHEQRVREIKALQAELSATQDPARAQAIQARLQALDKKEQDYQKQGAIARTVVSVVAMVVPGLQFLSPFISAANAAYSAAKGARNLEKAEQAEKEAARHEAEAVAHLVANGIPRDQALQVVARLKAGVPAEQALQSVLSGAPAPAPVRQEWKPMKLETPEAAQAAFLQWLKGWKPEVYEAVAKAADNAASPGAYRINDDLGEYEYQLSDNLGGLGFWDSIGSAVTNIANTAGTLLKTYYDKRVMDVQLKQLKAGQAPLPTQQAERVASGQEAPPAGSGAAAGMSSWPSWLLPVGIGVGAWFVFFRK